MTITSQLYVLLAPSGQLCGNGQLRETITERRNRKGLEEPFWYLSPSLVQKFNISKEQLEAVVAEDFTAINWLRLRFGGDLQKIALDSDLLKTDAMELPPPGTHRDISSLT